MKKTIIITGATRGIGLAIALRFASAKDNVVIFTKDTLENRQTAAEQIREAGGEPLVIGIDVMQIDSLREAVAQTVDRFGGIDILVNNKSATVFTNTLHTQPEEFDRVVGTSVRASYFLSQACVPHLRKSPLPHIINISPPLLIDSRWFKDHLAFSLSKYAMSLCTLGMAEEFRADRISVNSLWPQTTIATQMIKEHFVSEVFAGSRWPSIMGDAAYELSTHQCTGCFFTDEALLREWGISNFDHYAVDPTVSLMQALFIPKEIDRQTVTQNLFLAHAKKSVDVHPAPKAGGEQK